LTLRKLTLTFTNDLTKKRTYAILVIRKMVWDISAQETQTAFACADLAITHTTLFAWNDCIGGGGKLTMRLW